MRGFLKIALALALVGYAQSFAPVRRGSYRHGRVSKVAAGPADKLLESVKKMTAGFDVKDLQDRGSTVIKSASANVKSGSVGERGELFTAGQAALILFFLVGDIPILGDYIFALAGPGLLLGGLSLILAAALELGENITPFPAPVEENNLKTGGVYAYCRHPIYAGLVAACFGLGVVSESPQRMLIAGVLAIFLDYKASKEEAYLQEVHPAYETYKEEVAKFIPGAF